MGGPRGGLQMRNCASVGQIQTLSPLQNVPDAYGAAGKALGGGRSGPICSETEGLVLGS
jgi:hypothetical protein